MDDLAALAVREGKAAANQVIDAVGPESFTYRGLAETLGRIIAKQRPVVSVPPTLGYGVGWVLGKVFGDVMITWEEVKGLMANLLDVDSPAAGPTKLTEWAAAHAETLGRQYTSELARRIDRESEYQSN